MAEYPNRIVIDIIDGDENLEGYTLIEGFPGMGLVGTIATKYLIEKLPFKEKGYVYSNLFVPLVRIEKGLPQHPARIFIDKQHKLVAIVAEQIIGPGLIHPLASEIVAWVKNKGIKRVLSLNGLKVSGKENGEKVYGVCSREEEKPILEKKGIKVIEDGITSGITAQILLLLRDEEIEAVSLMAPVVMKADYKGAIAILSILSEFLNLEVNLEPLKKEAREIEKLVAASLQEIRKTTADSKKYDISPNMYS